MTEKTAARSKPRRITDYCAALVFYFQHILKFLFSGKMIATVIGNLDPWYLLGPWYLWKNRKESKKLKASLIVISTQYEYFKAGGYTFKARRMHTMYAVRYGKCGKDQFSANSQDYFRFLWNYASIRVIF